MTRRRVFYVCAAIAGTYIALSCADIKAESSNQAGTLTPVKAPVTVEEAIKLLGSPYQADRSRGAQMIEATKPLPVASLIKATEEADNVYIRQGASGLLLRLAEGPQVDEATRLALAGRIRPQEDAVVCINISGLLLRIKAINEVSKALEYFQARQPGTADEAVQIALIKLAAIDSSSKQLLKRLAERAESDAIRLAATAALIRMGVAAYEESLISAIHAEIDSVKKVRLMTILAETRTRGAFIVAAIYSSDGSATVREGAYEALVTIGSEDAARLLAGKVASDPAARETVLERLRRLGPLGMRFLREQWLRVAAEEASGRTSAPASRRQLMMLIKAAADFPQEEAVPLLIEMMEYHAQKDKMIAYQVQQALSNISGNSFGRSFYELSGDEEQAEVRAWKEWWKGESDIRGRKVK